MPANQESASANHTFSRVWIFPLSRRLSPEDEARLTGEVDEFLKSWKTHGTKLPGAHQILQSQVLLLMVEPGEIQASGCSIDALRRGITAILEVQNLTLFSEPNVIFSRMTRQGGEHARGSRALVQPHEGHVKPTERLHVFEPLQACDRQSFKQMIATEDPGQVYVLQHDVTHVPLKADLAMIDIMKPVPESWAKYLLP